MYIYYVCVQVWAAYQPAWPYTNCTQAKSSGLATCRLQILQASSKFRLSPDSCICDT